jgi:hypothetical protein
VLDYPDVYPAIFEQTYRFIRGDESSPDKEHPISPGVPEVLANDQLKIEPVKFTPEAFHPDLRPLVLKDLLSQGKAEIGAAEMSLAKARLNLTLAKERVGNLGADHRRTLASDDPSGFRESQVVDSLHSPQGDIGGKPSVKLITFEREIKPIIQKNCVGCHNSGNAMSGLDLGTVESVFQGGMVNGPAVVPRKSVDSPLVLYLKGEKQPRMPLGGAPLLPEQIALIAEWIDQFPEDEPQIALRNAEHALALAEKKLAWARANLPALEARIAADQAKYASPPNPKTEALALAARKAERSAVLLKAEVELLQAQQKMTAALDSGDTSGDEAEKVRENQVEVAQRQLAAAQATLKQATESYSPVGKIYPSVSTGRRLALARWIASKENPLTARVVVNQMWMRHFGKALVPTLVNFGISGKPPTHPELLDWLAIEFMNHNWSMKTLHRLMVTSNTYRMSSSFLDSGNPNVSIDSENIYLWRMNPRRVEAEVVRDTMLYVAGRLDTTMGGPELE